MAELAEPSRRSLDPVAAQRLAWLGQLHFIQQTPRRSSAQSLLKKWLGSFWAAYEVLFSVPF